MLGAFGPQGGVLAGDALSGGSLFAGLFVSGVGLGLFLYGKKQARLPQLVAGLLLMLLPFVVPRPLPMLGACAASVAALWFWLRTR